MDKHNRPIATAAKHAALTNLGKTLRKARQQAGYTQQAAGEHTGVTGQTVRNWETGRNEPPQPALDSLASLYGLNTEELKTDNPVSAATESRTYARQRFHVDPTALIQARKDAGLSQAETAQRSAVDISSIRRYERGSAKPTRAALQRLALVYGKPPLWLDPQCPNGTTILEPCQMDAVLRIYLELQPELTSSSVQAIGQFILSTHQNQILSDREQHTCPEALQVASSVHAD